MLGKYLTENEIESPDAESVKIAKSWENGEKPEWVERYSKVLTPSIEQTQ